MLHEARLPNAPKPLAGVFSLKTNRKVLFAHGNRLLTIATLALAASCSQHSFAQNNTPQPAAPAASPRDASATTSPSQKANHASSYYHQALAHSFQEIATASGRLEYAPRAIDEDKLAANADPETSYLNSHLAELYF